MPSKHLLKHDRTTDIKIFKLLFLKVKYVYFSNIKQKYAVNGPNSQDNIYVSTVLLFYLCYLLSNKSGIWKRILITVRVNKLKNVKFGNKKI